MGVIKGVLREELQNSKKMKNVYQERLKQYPVGSFQKKKIKGHYYFYLVHRNGKKVIYKYVGKKISKEDRLKLNKSIQNNHRYRKQIVKLNKQIRFLKKTLTLDED